MEQVTKERFFEVVGPMDVVTRVVGNYPYTTVFERKNRVVVGQIVESAPAGRVYPLTTEYFLVPQPAPTQEALL